MVTPLAGVWIEISSALSEMGEHTTVTPLAGVWIEISPPSKPLAKLTVTPLAGVWIEIVLYHLRIRGEVVTPLAGVWIEISALRCPCTLPAASHPSRVCGLKYHQHRREVRGSRSHPSRVCGLKFIDT